MCARARQSVVFSHAESSLLAWPIIIFNRRFMKGPGCVRLWLPYLRCIGMTKFAKGHFADVEN